MRGSGIRKSNTFLLLSVGALLCALFVMVTGMKVSAQSTSVNAIICTAGSSVAINEPASDSIVTEPLIVLKGSVNQASQIVIEIDGEYSGVEPLAAGQNQYEITVQLPRGTHTIKLTAVDTCGGTNAAASSVITYTPPPSSPSDGGTTPTGVNDGTQPQDGVTISGESIEPVRSSSGSILPAPVTETFNDVLKWLNIAPIDHSDPTESRMSLLGAITIAVGTYMATIGIATTVITQVASLSWFDRYKKSNRYSIASRGFRILGVLLIISGFFL